MKGKGILEIKKGKEGTEMKGTVLTIEPEVAAPKWLEELEKAIPALGAGRPGECVLVKAGVVSYRLCTKSFHCSACEFYQMVEEASIAGG